MYLAEGQWNKCTIIMLANFIKMRACRNPNIGGVPLHGYTYGSGKDSLMVFNMTLDILSICSMAVYTMYYNSGPFGPSKILWRPMDTLVKSFPFMLE